jgi:hypothetical protein
MHRSQAAARRCRPGAAAPPPRCGNRPRLLGRRQQRASTAASACGDCDADARAEPADKLASFGASLGMSGPALMQWLERAPPAVCGFSGEALEVTVASLEAALGVDRGAVSQLVRAHPHVLLAPHEPPAVLRLMCSLLRLPRGMVAASLRTRLHVLALTEAQLRERCAALGALLHCEDLIGGGGGGGGGGGLGGSPEERGFAAFAARYPGQAIALAAWPAAAVAERVEACAAALDGAPAGAVAALARARPLVLELSPLVGARPRLGAPGAAPGAAALRLPRQARAAAA